MATSVQLAELLATLFGARVSTCTNTYKQLQAADMVSKGGRGRNASQITASDCTLLVLSLLGSEHINDAPQAAKRYASLTANWREYSGPIRDDRASDDIGWFVMGQKFTALQSLRDNHALSETMAALIQSYADRSILDVASTASITVSIHGPLVSGTVSIEADGSTEKINYSAKSAAEMFRTVIGNPRPDHALTTRENYLRIEKHITGKTLKELGDLVRE